MVAVSSEELCVGAPSRDEQPGHTHRNAFEVPYLGCKCPIFVKAGVNIDHCAGDLSLVSPGSYRLSRFGSISGGRGEVRERGRLDGARSARRG